MAQYVRRALVPGKTAAELYEVASSSLSTLLGQVGECSIHHFPDTQEIQMRSPVFSAMVRCTEGEMECRIELSFLAAPLRSKIDESITRWLSRTFQV